MATIAHLDMDAFYVSIELCRRPELRGLPVVVAGDGPRAVVTTASYEARRFGVGSAIPASRARRLCPQAVFLPPDFEAYRAASKQVMALVRGTVEQVEVMGLDEAYLDLSGLVAPRAAMRRLVQSIREQTGLTASVGIGPNKLVAKVASDAEKPSGFVVLSREQACERFAKSPPKLLPGIGAKSADRLKELEITTLEQLAATDPGELAQHFGPRLGPWLVRRAQFYGEEHLDTTHVAVSESRETTFPADIGDRAVQHQELRKLSARLAEGLRKHDRRGRTIAIKVRLADFTTVTRARTVAHATNDTEAIAEVAAALLDEYAPPQAVRLLGVRMASFVNEDAAAVAAEEDGQLALPI